MSVTKDKKNPNRYKVSSKEIADGRNKLKKHNGKTFSQLNAQQKDELLLVLLQLAGMADKNGVIHVK